MDLTQQCTGSGAAHGHATHAQFLSLSMKVCRSGLRVSMAPGRLCSALTAVLLAVVLCGVGPKPTTAGD